MKQTIKRFLLLTTAVLIPLAGHAQNTVVTYQGRVTSNGTNFTGSGLFKFALVTSTNNNLQATATAVRFGDVIPVINVSNPGSGYLAPPAVSVAGGGGSGVIATATIGGGTVTAITVNNPGSGYTSTPTVTIEPPPANISYVTYWSHDGTSSAGSQPVTTVIASVANGLFTMPLGDPTLANMTSIPAALFNQPDLQLRIWFNDGVNGFAALSPLQKLTAAPYAMQAANADTAATAGTVLGLNVNTNLSSVALGTANTASAAYATVSGGTDNSASGERASVGGGDFNTASGNRAVVAGGYANVASGYTAALGGGLGNLVSGNYATISGGDNNIASGGVSVVGGGSANQATNNAATVPGGANNLAGGQYSFAAGQRARALQDGTFVWADSQNADFASTTLNQFAIRAAGGFFLDGRLGIGLSAPGYPLDVKNSQAVGRFTTTNNANGAVLILNNASPSAAYLGAINFETNGSTVGQIGYLASDQMTFRVGGNEVASISPTGLIVNGTANLTFLSAFEASAANLISTDLLQMHQSTQSGSHTFTGSLRQMLSLAPSTLFGPDGPGLGLQTNNLYFRSQSAFSWFRRGTHRDTPYDPGTSLFEAGVEMMRLTTSGLTVNGAFIGASDRNLKENFKPVDARAVLDKVAALPLSEWNYKSDTASRHVGPMAQDFYAAFGVGPDDQHITTVDADGVALAAIQGLNQKVMEELKQKTTEITELRRELAEIKNLLDKLSAKGN